MKGLILPRKVMGKKIKWGEGKGKVWGKGNENWEWEEVKI